jgi:hypothetical protein
MADDQTIHDTGGGDVVDRPLSESESTALASAQAKLAEMTGGASRQASGGSVRHQPSRNQRDMAERNQRATDARRARVISTLERARDRAREQEQQQQEDGRSRGVAPEKSMAAIDNAEARRKQITQQLITGDLDDAERQKLTTELKQLVAKSMTEEERQADTERTVESRREEHGVKDIEFISPQYREAWNEANEAEFYEFASQEGMDSSLVQSLVHDYASEAQMNDGKVTDAMVDAFYKKYQHRLSQQTRDKLVKWVRGS